MTVHTFSGNKKFISGNKCEKGVGRGGDSSRPNLFQYQYERIFQHYQPREPQHAPLGEIGLPRVLNMFENYPYWFTLFDELGFRVVLSEQSTSKMYNKGLDSVSSQTLCFPAKLVHGHILNLIEKGVKRIFYPALPMERAEFKESVYSYNCPVVGSYPEIIRLNIDEIKENHVDLISPFLPIDDSAKQLRLLLPLFKSYGVTKRNLKQALDAATEEQTAYKADLRRVGEETLEKLNADNEPGIVLTGRPYHLDPLIHHGIPELIVSSGAAVLSGDSVAHLGEKLLFPLQVVDQWGYHARLYRAATLTARQPLLQMIQLTSFGCGLDAVTAEQVGEILASVGKVHTLIKIDEGTQLGAVRIRVRSLLSTMMNATS
jgi:predicted nucleotide-binding protein (sugar kinase/HSP70/actin superfamily)